MGSNYATSFPLIVQRSVLKDNSGSKHDNPIGWRAFQTVGSVINQPGLLGSVQLITTTHSA